MSKRKTSSEVQEHIRQRYEDTAQLIYRQQHVIKQSNLSSQLRTRQAFEDVDVQELRGRPAVIQENVQSQVCVII